jgi:hypothetical protein
MAALNHDPVLPIFLFRAYRRGRSLCTSSSHSLSTTARISSSDAERFGGRLPRQRKDLDYDT